MRPVSDAFLLIMAEVSATLIGLFLVGVYFYLQGGLRRWDQERGVIEPYLRAGTRFIFIVFGISLGLSLTLVALEPSWSRILFALLSVLLLVASVDSVTHIRGVAKVTGSTALVVNEVITTAMALVIVATPWVLGGFRPTREDLTWAILLAFAAGFLSIGATVMSAFVQHSRIDAARTEAEEPD